MGVVITWRDKVVARLMLPASVFDRERARRAAARIRARRKGQSESGVGTSWCVAKQYEEESLVA